MSITAIYAQGSNGEFGLFGKLPPWDCADDRQFFRDATVGGAVIMGRHTAESLPKPLKDRLNIIVTSKPPSKLKQAWRLIRYKKIYVANLPQALEVAQMHRDNVYIIGGKDLIKEALPYCDMVARTTIHGTYPADVYMDPLPPEWVTTTSVSTADADFQLFAPMSHVLAEMITMDLVEQGGEVC